MDYMDPLRYRPWDPNAPPINIQSSDFLPDSANFLPEALPKLSGRSLVKLSQSEIDEGQILLANRWLERGCGALLIAPSGHGKSTAAYQMAACWSCGKDAFAIRPANPSGLRVLVIQSEDSANDLIEMSRCIRRLGLNDAQLALVDRNTHVETLNDAVGRRFIEVLDSFLDQWPAELLMINPLSGYMPCELRDEREVKFFLGSYFNRLLAKHRCGALCVQPTPKTNYQGTEAYNWYDWIYWAAGSAEFARWARAGLVIVPTSVRGTYRFIAAKRFEKSGWETPEYWFAHSWVEDAGLWVPASQEQIVCAKKAKALSPEDVLAFIPPLDPISQEQYFEATRGKVNEKYARRFVNLLIDQGKVRVVTMPRNGRKAGVGYVRT